MAQITKGDTFVDGQQLTAARLNQLVDSATVLPNIITDQTNLTANTVASGDSVLLYDLSATALREATASDLLNSGIAVTTSSITAGANSDITLTPNDATIVSGATYTSGDGLTVVVTSNAHGLAVGQVVLISGAGTGYNGTFRLTAVSTNTFTYVMTTAATAGSGSLSFTKKATGKIVGNEAVTGNLYVDGNAVITGTTVQTGAVTQSGAITQTGAVTQSGTVNITGAIQYNGTPVFGLYEVYEETISSSTTATASNWNNVFTSSSITKPSDEIWKFEMVVSVQIPSVSSTTTEDHYLKTTNTANSVTYYHRQGKQIGVVAQTLATPTWTHELNWLVNSGTALTSETIKLWGYNKTGTGTYTWGYSGADSVTGTTIPASKLRIYKYKTA